MSDRKLFNETVYTPLSEALSLLEERRNNPELMAKVEKLLNGDVPSFFKEKGKCGVLGRHIATPNHESRMFITLAHENNLFPVFFEFHDDKFTPQSNAFKHSLGQLHIPEKTNKYGHANIERTTIVDFNKHSGKKIKDVKTLWEQPLVDFHKNLFSEYNINKDFCAYDGSSWYKNHGEKVSEYYVNFLMLFTCFGVLFENFLLSKDEEGEFTRNIVLPAIEKVIRATGIKPLIVPLSPLEIETDDLWYYHLIKAKKSIPKLTL